MQGRGCDEVGWIWDPLPGTLIRDSYISIRKRLPFVMRLQCPEPTFALKRVAKQMYICGRAVEKLAKERDYFIFIISSFITSSYLSRFLLALPLLISLGQQCSDHCRAKSTSSLNPLCQRRQRLIKVILKPRSDFGTRFPVSRLCSYVS